MNPFFSSCICGSGLGRIWRGGQVGISEDFNCTVGVSLRYRSLQGELMAVVNVGDAPIKLSFIELVPLGHS